MDRSVNLEGDCSAPLNMRPGVFFNLILSSDNARFSSPLANLQIRTSVISVRPVLPFSASFSPSHLPMSLRSMYEYTNSLSYKGLARYYMYMTNDCLLT